MDKTGTETQNKKLTMTENNTKQKMQ